MFDTKNNILKISNTSAFKPYNVNKKTINIKDVIMKINVDENGKILGSSLINYDEKNQQN
jgi:hypothetical protein